MQSLAVEMIQCNYDTISQKLKTGCEKKTVGPNSPNKDAVDYSKWRKLIKDIA